MPNVSIAVAAQDNYSTAIKSMLSVTRGFSKETEDLQRKMDMLNKNKVLLKVDADKARAELVALAKQFSKTGFEADGLKMQLANENYENLRRNLELVTKGVREVERAMVSANGAVSKSQNKAFSKDSLAERLATAGATKMIGDVLAQGANLYVGSAFGSDAGSMFGNALNGAVSGAAVGNLIFPGVVGLTAGAAVGTIVGAGNGAMQNFQKQDDAFKSVVQSEYERLQQNDTTTVMSGIDIAASREMDKIAFGKLYKNDLVGSAQQEWAIETANQTPFLYEDIKAISKTLATYGYSSQETRGTVMQIGDAGAALGMSTQDMSMVATGLGRMKSTGKTTMEYMNLLIERGIPASEYLAEAFGKTQGEIAEMVTKGLIPGAEAAQIIADSMGKVNEGAMERMSKTFTGLSSTLQGWKEEFQDAAGMEYLEIRTPALEEQGEYYDLMGNRYEEVAGVSGKLMAVQENRKERIFRDTMNAMFNDTDGRGYGESIKAVEQAEATLYNAEATGDKTLIATAEDAFASALATTQRLIDEAEAEAEALYRNSDMEKTIQNANIELVNSLRGFLKEDGMWKGWGYNLGVEMGKGMMSVQPENAMVPNIVPERYAYDNFAKEPSATPGGSYAPVSAWQEAYSKKAFGQALVPYDNFPALLHQGERVLTASEARSYNQETPPPISITGNNFYIREEADIDRVAEQLAANLRRAKMTYAP